MVCGAPRIKDEPDAQPRDLASASAMSGISVVLWLFLTKGEEILVNLLHCTAGKGSGASHPSPLHTWGALVYKSTEQPQISAFSCGLNLQSWSHYFWHTLLCSAFLPSLKHTLQCLIVIPLMHQQQLTELQLLLHILFLLFRYVLFH